MEFMLQQERFYSEPISQVFNCDCMDFMRTLPDKFFDLAIVDPPYFSGPERRQFYGQANSKIGVKRVYKKSNHWQLPDMNYWNELNRIANRYIIWGCNYFPFSYHSGRIIWDKVNDSSDYSDCELAATNIFDHVRVFRYMWNGMMQGESVTNGTKMQGNKKLNELRIHPTQKPVALYKWLLKKYAKPGDKIFDSHMGSQSSRVAAHEMGFDYWGCELDGDYFQEGNKRFNNYNSQLKIFQP